MDQHQIRLEIEKVMCLQNEAGEVFLDKLRELCSRYPSSSEVWLEYALSLDRLSKESEAIPAYLKALELGLEGDKIRIASICLASSYRNVGQIDEALETIQEARRKFPEDPVVNCFYAMILHDAGFSAKAIQILGLTLVNISKPGSLKGFEKGLEVKFNEMVNDQKSGELSVV